MPVTFINPEAQCLVPAQVYNLAIDLGKPATVGLVINKIVHCDVFMKIVGDTLLQARPGTTIKYYETGKITYADDALMCRVAEECDAAICAIGHCGSCTAGTVKDGIALVSRNCPAVSLVTEIFWEQATTLSRSLGWPDAPRVQLPYPIWGTDEISMRAVADDVIINILEALENSNAQAA